MDNGQLSKQPEKFFCRHLIELARKHRQHDAEDKLNQMVYDEENPTDVKGPRNNKG